VKARAAGLEISLKGRRKRKKRTPTEAPKQRGKTSFARKGSPVKKKNCKKDRNSFYMRRVREGIRNCLQKGRQLKGEKNKGGGEKKRRSSQSSEERPAATVKDKIEARSGEEEPATGGGT